MGKFVSDWSGENWYWREWVGVETLGLKVFLKWGEECWGGLLGCVYVEGCEDEE